MSKMKLLFCIVAMFSLALVSCTERLPEKEMQDVDNGVITMIKATVEPLCLKGTTEVGNFEWKETHNIGIYGSLVGENECYLPVKTTVGDSEAYFYGNAVGGELKLYMPYVSGGNQAALDNRVTVPAEQYYYATALDHLMYNSTFLGEGDVDEVKFDYHSGLVKIELYYDIQNITSMTIMNGNFSTGGDYSQYIVGDISVDEDVEEFLVNGSNKLVIKGFPEGVNATTQQPATVWAALAPGIYEAFVVEVSNGDITTSLPVEGPFVVEKCAIAEKVCAIREIPHDNGIGDFEGENGEFNPKN